ncbi:hypothetical protein [Paludisphaera mucosa]|uniref:Uncharacterized protein n=1 Tax=Paludisphaera mucosa TaxID=3030827 RepID=A0ABT6FHQ4_9BACT|nr:hypothetical protein [Paludisphaera mucosa]MDG3007126.1 hypothetical protein [Paludisphaera mucosa]
MAWILAPAGADEDVAIAGGADEPRLERMAETCRDALEHLA